MNHRETLCSNQRVNNKFVLFYLSMNGDIENLRKQSKFIVFLKQLLVLFTFCHTCKTENPLTETCESGTIITVVTTCNNPKCPKNENTWRSQPFMPESKIPAGNFLLSFAILVAGGPASKTLKIFEHMGLSRIKLSTFFEHQRVSTGTVYLIFRPKFLLHWIRLLKILHTLVG